MPASVPHRPRAEQAPQAAASPSVLRADRVHDGERLGGPGWIALVEGRVAEVVWPLARRGTVDVPSGDTP